MPLIGQSERVLYVFAASRRAVVPGKSNIGLSPNSVHTVGVLAVTLGMADSFAAYSDVYASQLLCAGAVLRACCLAPVQTKRSPAPLFVEKHNGFSTLFLSAQIVAGGWPRWLLRAPGSPSRALSRCPKAPAGTSRIPPLRFLLKESFLRIPLPGFLLQDSTSRIPP